MITLFKCSHVVNTGIQMPFYQTTNTLKAQLKCHSHPCFSTRKNSFCSELAFQLVQTVGRPGEDLQLFMTCA